MPEGPEIRLAADKIAAVLENKLVEAVSFGQPKMMHYAEDFQGQMVTHIETRGKAMLTHFNHGYTIYSHNQLYGIWKVSKRGKFPKTNRTLRATKPEKSPAPLWRHPALHCCATVLCAAKAICGPDNVELGRVCWLSGVENFPKRATILPEEKRIFEAATVLSLLAY